jgi:hypothetical protein
VAREREDGYVYDDVLRSVRPPSHLGGKGEESLQRAGGVGVFGGLDWHVEITALKQDVPRTQSASDAHGKAHFAYATLQR